LAITYDFASARLGLFSFQISQILGLVMRDRACIGSAEQAAHDPAGRRRVLDASRKIAAEILRGAFEAFVGEIAQHEFGILGADGLTAVDDVAAAEHLDLHALARAAGLDELVDELLHRVVAVAGRHHLGAPFAVLIFGKHEVIHSTESGHRIANACGHARPQHRHEGLVGLGRHLVFARIDLHQPSPRRRVEEFSTSGHSLFRTAAPVRGPSNRGDDRHVPLR
jgi:hypothetical protein